MFCVSIGLLFVRITQKVTDLCESDCISVSVECTFSCNFLIHFQCDYRRSSFRYTLMSLRFKDNLSSFQPVASF